MGRKKIRLRGCKVPKSKGRKYHLHRMKAGKTRVLCLSEAVFGVKTWWGGRSRLVLEPNKAAETEDRTWVWKGYLSVILLPVHPSVPHDGLALPLMLEVTEAAGRGLETLTQGGELSLRGRVLVFSRHHNNSPVRVAEEEAREGDAPLPPLVDGEDVEDFVRRVLRVDWEDADRPAGRGRGAASEDGQGEARRG